MTTAAFDQDSFAFYNDGTESGATIIGTKNVNITAGAGLDVELDTVFAIRHLMQETAGGMGTNQNAQLQYDRNGGASWQDVNASSQYIQTAPSGNLTDGDDTTQRLGSGTYITNNNWVEDVDGLSGACSFSGNDEAESLHSIQVISADCQNGDTFDFRILLDGSPADATTNTGRITVTVPATTSVQTNFRIRSDDSVGLNTDSGWEAALNGDVTLDAEVRFRIRIEVEENTGGTLSLEPRLDYQKNGTGGYVAVTDYDDADPSLANVPPVSIHISDQYVNGDATTNILSGSSETFTAGDGYESNTPINVNLSNQHSEFEWCIVIRRLYGDGQFHVDGDYFDFRISDNGTALTTYTNTPRITLNTEGGIIGGTYGESPTRAGPIMDGNGNLYSVHESSEKQPTITMNKSTDGGNLWTVEDQAGAPTNGDMESHCMVYDGVDTIWILHQPGASVFLHQYFTSEHATTPDEWGTVDTTVTSGITETDQAASLVLRSDGTMIGFYCTGTDSVGYKIRTAGGSWGGENDLDSEAGVDFRGVHAVVGESDKTWVFYKDNTNGILYVNSITSGDTLETRQAVASSLATGVNDRIGCTNPVYYDDGGVEVITIAYSLTDDTLESRQLRDGSFEAVKAVTTEAVELGQGGSRKPGADLVNDGDVVYCIYVDASTRDTWYRTSTDGGAWTSATEMNDGVDVDYIYGSIYTHSAGNGGDKVVGYTIDNRRAYHPTLGGFTGGGEYHELVIQAGGGADIVPSISRRLRQRRSALLRM